jgi:opacity protein-like surface antigen
MRARLIVAVLTALCIPALALAAPPKGFSVLVGSGNHTNETAAAGTPQSYDSGGFALGFDVQLPQGDSTSLNVLYLLWLDSAPITNEMPIAEAAIVESVLALQMRYWPTEAMFFGAHLGLYQQALAFDFLQPEDGLGLGFGVAGGLEVELNEKVRLTLAAQYDRAPSMSVIRGLDATDLSGFTLLLGMRFVQ